MNLWNKLRSSIRKMTQQQRDQLDASRQSAYAKNKLVKSRQVLRANARDREFDLVTKEFPGEPRRNRRRGEPRIPGGLLGSGSRHTYRMDRSGIEGRDDHAGFYMEPGSGMLADLARLSQLLRRTRRESIQWTRKAVRRVHSYRERSPHVER